MVNSAPYGDLIPVVDGKIFGATVPAAPDSSVWPEGASSFSGWFVQNADGSYAQFDPNMEITENLTLYAQFEMNSKVLISFLDADGLQFDSVSIAKGDIIPKTDRVPEAPERKTFLYWALSENPTEEFSFGSATANTDMTFVPVFSDTHTVEFIAEGSDDIYDPQMVESGKKAVKPADPVREGYAFMGWSADQVNVYDFDTPVQQDFVLYALWEGKPVNYSVVLWMEKPNIPVGQALSWPNDYMTYKVLTPQQANAGTVIDAVSSQIKSEIDSIATSDHTIYYFDKANAKLAQPVTIEGNGQSVLNVLVDRIVYTEQFTMKSLQSGAGVDYGTMKWTWANGNPPITVSPGDAANGKVVYSFQAKFEQDITNLWPSVNGNVTIENFSDVASSTRGVYQPDAWSSTFGTGDMLTKRLVLAEDLLPPVFANTSVMTWATRYTKSPVRVEVSYWYEALSDETGTPIPKDNVTNFAPSSARGYVRNPELDQVLIADQNNVQPKDLEGLYKVAYRQTTRDDGTTLYDFYYNRNPINVVFNLNGGSLEQANTDRTRHGEKINTVEPNAEPTKNKSIFLGWYYDSTFTRPVDWQKDVALSSIVGKTATQTINLYAKWQSSDYTVTFYDQKGSGSSLEQRGAAAGGFVDPYQPAVVMNVEGSDYTLTSGVAVPGYGVFDGWRWVGDDNVVRWFTAGTRVSKDMDVYAFWKTDGFTVTYDAGGATGSVPTDTTKYKLGASARVKGNIDLVVQDKAFIGWENSVDGKIYYAGGTFEIAGNTVLTAKFGDESYYANLTFQPGYEGSGQQDQVLKVVKSQDTNLLGEDAFTRDDYVLVGWKGSDGSNYDLNDKIKPSKDMTFEAVWKADFTITFLAGEGGLLKGDAVFAHIGENTTWGAAVQVPEPVANEGYYFAQWDKTFPNESSVITGSAVYTAQFAPKTEITLEAASKTWEYDGKAHTLSDVTQATKDALLPGDTIKVIMADTSVVTDVADGAVSNVIASYQILRNGVDVTNQYQVTIAAGTLQVEAAKVTINVGSGGKTYGDADPSIDVSIEGFPGEDPQYEIVIGGKDAGTQDVTVKLPDSIKNDPNYDITINPGTLEIAPLAITVKANSDSVPFNNQTQFVSGYTVDKNLPYGDVLSVNPNPSASGRMPGEYPSEIAENSVAITGTDSLSKIANYVIKTEDGKLTIGSPQTPGSLDWTINGSSETAQYDGTVHTINGDAFAAVLPEGFYVEPDSIAVTNPSEINVNSSESGTGSTVYKQVIDASNAKIFYNDAQGTAVDVTSWFAAPTIKEGTLTITPADLEIELVVNPTAIAENDAAPDMTLRYATFVDGDNAGNAFVKAPSIDMGTFDSNAIVAGSYEISVSGAQAKYGNYNITYKNNGVQTLTVAAAGGLTYNNNGFPFVAPTDGKTYAQGQSAVVNTADISVPGYTFLGWATEPNGEVVYAAGSVGSYVFTADDAKNGRTLYAVGKADFTGEGAITAVGHESIYNGTNTVNGLPDGEKKSIRVTTNIEGDVIWYATELNEDGTLKGATTQNPAYVNAATETVYYQVVRGNDRSEVGFQTVKINPAPVTVTPDGQTIKRGDSAPSNYSYTIGEGVVPGEDLSVVVAGYDTTYDAAAPKSGDFDIRFAPGSTWANKNYDVTFAQGTLTVTAAWQVSYDANGGQNAPVDTKYYAPDETVTVDQATQPSRDGFVFLGWDENKDATTPAYPAGADSSFNMPNLATGDSNNDDATKPLYAVWAVDSKQYRMQGITKVYNGEASTIQVQGPAGVAFDVVYSYTDAAGQPQTSTTAPSFTNVADSTTVTAKISVNGVAADQELMAAVNITKRPVAVKSADAPTVTYDGTEQTGQTTQFADITDQVASAMGYLPGEFGLIAGHSIDAKAAVTQKDAGVYDLVFDGAYGVYLRDANGVNMSDNYMELAQARQMGSFEIEKANVSVAPTYTGKLYNGAEPDWTAAGAYLVSGLMPTDREADVLGTITVSRDPGESAKAYPIKVEVQNKTPRNYNVTVEPGNFVIAPAGIEAIITPNADGKVYGQADKSGYNGITVVGNLPDDLVYEIVRTPGENANGDYELSIRFGDNPNYDLSKLETGTSKYVISPAPITIKADDKSMIYGDANPPALSATITGNVKQGDKIDYSLEREDAGNMSARDYAINVIEGNNPNYAVTVVPGNFTIYPAEVEVVITPQAASKTYGDEDQTLTAAVKGTFAGDTIQYRLVRTEGENVGTYQIKVELVGDNANYKNIKLETADFTINPAEVTVTAQNAGKIYGADDPQLQATVTGAKYEDKINYTLSRAAGEDVGIYQINVTPGENPNYKVVVRNGEFTITPQEVDVIITPDNATKVYGQADPRFTSVVTGTANSNQLNYRIVRAAGETVGEYELSVELGNNPNYKIRTGTGVFTVTPAPATILVADQTKVAGAADPSLTAKVEGIVNDDNITYTLTRTAGEEVGLYPINATYRENANYDVRTVPGTLTITAAATEDTPTTTDPAIPPVAPAAPVPPATPPTTTLATALTNLPQTIRDFFGDLMTLGNPDTPLANADRNIQLGNQEVPLAAGGNSPAWALLNLLFTILTGIISLVVVIAYFFGKKKKEQENEKSELYAMRRMRTERYEDEDAGKLKKKGIARLISIVVAIVAVVIFILTEDMRLPMVMMDKYTILMAIIAIAQIVVAFFTKKSRKKDDDERQENRNTQAQRI